MSTDAVQEDGPFFAIVKFELKDPATEADFNHWYNFEHLPDLVSGNGIAHGWRSKELREAPNVGGEEQPFFATYEMDTVERFRRPARRPEGTPPPPPPDPPRRPNDMSGLRLVENMGQVFYSLVGRVDGDGDTRGTYVREELSFDGSDAEREAFESELVDSYVPRRLAAAGGVHALVLKSLETDLQVGPDTVGEYLVVYEVGDPSDFDAGAAAPPGTSRDALHFAGALFDISHDDAIAARIERNASWTPPEPAAP